MTAEHTEEMPDGFDESSDRFDAFCKGNVVTSFGSYSYATEMLEEQYRSIKAEGNTVTFNKYQATESSEETYVFGYIEFIRLLYGLKLDAKKVCVFNYGKGYAPGMIINFLKIYGSENSTDIIDTIAVAWISIAPKAVEFIIDPRIDNPFFN